MIGTVAMDLEVIRGMSARNNLYFGISYRNLKYNISNKLYNVSYT